MRTYTRPPLASMLLPSLLLTLLPLGGCYLEDPDGCSNCTPTDGGHSLDEDADGDNYSEDQGDCDDEDAGTHPHAPEPDDGQDNDCDGTVDEGSAPTQPPGHTPTEPPEGTPAPSTPTAAPTPTATTAHPTPTAPPPTPTATPAPTPTATPTPWPDPVDGEPDVVLDPMAGADRLAALSDLKWIGDFDGDGFDDFAASVQLGTEGRVYLYYGGLDFFSPSDDGLPRAPDAVITGIGSPDTNGVRLGVGGDVDGDGTDDVLLGDVYQRRVNLFLGDTTRRTGEIAADGAAAVFHSFIEGSYAVGMAMAIVPDMDGDGRGEIAIGVPAFELGRGEVALFYGRTDLTGVIDVSTADVRLRGAVEGGATGSQVFSLRDLDGDGLGDLGIVSSLVPHGPITTVTRGTFTVVYGNRLRPAGVVSLTGLPTLYAPLSDSLVGVSADVGDLDGDGSADLAIGIPSGGSQFGRAFLIYGNTFRLTNGNLYIDEIGAEVFGRDEHDVAFGSSVALASDITGDGRSDLVVASPRLRSETLADSEGEVPDPSELDNEPGYAVIFAGNPARPTLTAADHAWGFVDGALLGYDVIWPVSTGGDLDGDGQGELLVGGTTLDAEGEAKSALLVLTF